MRKWNVKMKKILITGIAIGVVFGILLTIAAAKHVVDSHEEKLTAQNKKPVSYTHLYWKKQRWYSDR